MNRNTVILTTALIVSVSTYMLQCAKKETKTIRVFGSTTIEPFMKKAADQFAKTRRITFSIKAVGSNAGIDSLITGACDIAMSSTEISSVQISHAKKAGISLKTYLLGYDIIVPIVHPSNRVADITFGDLRKVYAGTIRRWSAMGGNDTVIDVVDRPRESGTYTVWHHDVVPPQVTDDHFTVQPSNSSVVAYVSTHTNAIGYVSCTFVNPEVKPLKLDGIAITESDSLLPEYHFKRPLYLYINEEKFDREARLFVMFLLIDERGRALLHKEGFFSIFNLSPLFKAGEIMNKD